MRSDSRPEFTEAVILLAITPIAACVALFLLGRKAVRWVAALVEVPG